MLWILRRSTSTLVLSHRRRRRCRHLATARHGVPGLPQLAHRIPAPDVAPRSRVRNASAERNSAGNTLGIGPIITIRGLPRHALLGRRRRARRRGVARHRGRGQRLGSWGGLVAWRRHAGCAASRPQSRAGAASSLRLASHCLTSSAGSCPQHRDGC